MRTLAQLCALFLLTLATSQAGEDTFASLRDLTQKKLPAKCECSPIAKNEMSGWRYFEVSSPDSHFRIILSERGYFTQQDWQRELTETTKYLEEYFAKPAPTKAENLKMTEAIKRLSALPNASYQGIGINVDLQTPDETYPDFEKDGKEAYEWFSIIVLPLDGYSPPDQSPSSNSAKNSPN